MPVQEGINLRVFVSMVANNFAVLQPPIKNEQNQTNCCFLFVLNKTTKTLPTTVKSGTPKLRLSSWFAFKAINNRAPSKRTDTLFGLGRMNQNWIHKEGRATVGWLICVVDMCHVIPFHSLRIETVSLIESWRRCLWAPQILSRGHRKACQTRDLERWNSVFLLCSL